MWEEYETREAWLARRRQLITSTDAPVILGLSRYKSPYLLYLEKRGELPPREPGPWARWGLVLEDLIAQMYAEETGRPVRRPSTAPFALALGPEPWLGATIDRLAEVDGETLVVEVKNASAFRADEWAELPPLEYQVQVQHQMAVLGLQRASLAVLIGGNTFRWADVERDEPFVAALREKEAAFWRRVQEGEAPPVDASRETTEALARLHPRVTGPMTLLGGDAIGWDQERTRIKAEIDRLEGELRFYENQLKAAIGDAEGAVLPNGVTYTWRVQRRAEHLVPAAEFRVLRRSAPRKTQ